MNIGALSPAVGNGHSADGDCPPTKMDSIGRGSAQTVEESNRTFNTILGQQPGQGQVQVQFQRAKLGPRSEELSKAIVWAAHLSPILNSEYLVKGWIYRGQTSVLYGAANVGKTFLALALAHAISKGQVWNGSRVRRGRVLYIATEGGSGLSNRVSALADPEFYVLSAPLLLTGERSQGRFLTEALRNISPCEPFDFIVIDTMARVMGAADENLAPDIADFLSNVGAIQRATGAHVMIVHHSGKDTERGARGHSSLRAAVDTEIELKRNDKTGLISALITKQRDGSTGNRFDYVLQQVKLGLDQDGDPVTTCVVEPKGRIRTSLADMTDPQRRALGILETLVKKEETVLFDRWQTACIVAKTLAASTNLESHAKAFKRASGQLIDLGLVCVRGGMVSVAKE
jgi:cellulose biosynthesis protein BcsQ